MSTRHPRRNPRPRNTLPLAETPAPDLPDRPEAKPSAGLLAYSVDEAARLTGLYRDLLYDEMRRRNLPCLKIGRRRLITRRHPEAVPRHHPRASGRR